jgi:hypothetical protein
MSAQAKKFDEIDAMFEHSPQKILRPFEWDTRLSEQSARRAKKLLQLKPYKTTVVSQNIIHKPCFRVAV